MERMFEGQFKPWSPPDDAFESQERNAGGTEPETGPHDLTLGQREFLSSIEECRGDAEEVLKRTADFWWFAYASFPYKHDNLSDGTYDLDFVATALRREGVKIDKDLLLSLFEERDFERELLSLELLCYLSITERIEFLREVAPHFSEIIRDGLRDYHERVETRHGEDDVPENAQLFEVIVRLAGTVDASGLSEFERKSFEDEYLRFLRRCLLDQLISCPKSEDYEEILDDQTVFFERLAQDRVTPQPGDLYPILISPELEYHLDDSREESEQIDDDARIAASHHFLNGALEALETYGSRKTIDFAAFWTEFNPRGTNGYQIAGSCSRIDANYAAKRFLPLLHHLDDDVVAEATSFLHRLEFGNVGISEEGVRYLEKMYDLGEFNNPGYFVRRLTANGEVGVFDENRRLVRYFELTGLDSDEAVIKARTFEFAHETLFTPKEGETPEERAEREQYLREFQENYFGFYDDEFFKNTGVAFNNLSFKEQGQLLIFFKTADEDERARAIKFLRMYKEDGFRAFLSLEHGREMGEKILVVGEKLSRPAAERVFGKYAEVVRASEQVRGYLREKFGQKSETDAQVDRVVENLLRRGKDLLVSFSEMAEVETRPETKNITQRLDMIRSDVILFASAFSATSRNGEIPLENLRGVETVSLPAPWLRSEEKDEMERMFLVSRGEVKPELLNILREEFRQGLESRNCVFNTLRHDDALVSFMRFEKQADGSLYAGSFTVRDEARHGAIGRAFARAVIEERGAFHSIEALIEARSPLVPFYKKLGFEVVGEEEDEGVRFARIRRPASRSAPEEVLPEPDRKAA